MKPILLVVVLGIGCFAGSGMAWGQTKKPYAELCFLDAKKICYPVDIAGVAQFDDGTITVNSCAGPQCDKPKPEPMDVEAINHPTKKEVCRTPDVLRFCTSVGCDCRDGYATIDEPHWTCADKSRILLTGEDGVRHCVKFAEAK